MAEYAAPLKDMRFVLEHVVGLDQVNQLPGWEEITDDVADAILEEAAKFAAGVLSPLNAPGDRAGASCKDGHVAMPPGFRDAYSRFVGAGWGNILSPPEYGGQGLPHLLATPVEEMWGAANLAFKLCPMLTQGAIEALQTVASEALKQRFLPKMVSGEWTGTMNLTEPQAGSRPAARAHEGGRPEGRHLAPLRAEDLHHLWRARLRPTTSSTWCSRASPGAARGREGHLAVRGAESHWSTPDGSAGRAQRREVRLYRAQARHPRESRPRS